MYPTVCQFQDSMMVVCDCHSEGMMLTFNKEDKVLYLQHWTISTKSGIFSHNISDAFRYLFTGKDITTRVVDIDREAMYQIACFVNDSFKLKKKIEKKARSKEALNLSFYVNGMCNRRLDVKNYSEDLHCHTFVFTTHDDWKNKDKRWRNFWKILTKGTTGVNEITVDKFEAEMFLDYMNERLHYDW